MPNAVRRPVRRWLPALALTLALLPLATCGGGQPEASPTSSPSPFVPSPIGDSTVTPTPPAPETPYRFVYREFGQEQDIIWRVLPSDPSQREQLAVIPHRQGWGIKASLSPDGRLLAYLTMPEGAFDPSFQAEAYLFSLKNKDTRLLAKNVDLRFRPLWSPDGLLLYVRRNIQQDVYILHIDIPHEPAEGERTPRRAPAPTGETPAPEDPVRAAFTANISTALTFIPIGFADDGESLYFIQIQGGTGGGTLVGSYKPATTSAIATATALAGATATAVSESGATIPPEPPPFTPTPGSKLVVKLTEQIADDYDLSPDKRRLTFRAQALVEGRFVNQAFVADLKSETVQAISAEGLTPGDQLRPLWHPDGQRVAVGLLPAAAEPSGVALVPVAGGPPSFLWPPSAGFDEPRSWAPDGTYLAVTNYSGDSLANLGTARLDLVASTGQRVTVADGRDNATRDSVLGWFKFE